MRLAAAKILQLAREAQFSSDLSSFLMISVKDAASCAVIIARLGVVLFFRELTASLAIVEANED